MQGGKWEFIELKVWSRKSKDVRTAPKRTFKVRTIEYIIDCLGEGMVREAMESPYARKRSCVWGCIG